jgi:hypothetical protein
VGFLDHQMQVMHLERFYDAEVINGQDNGAEGPSRGHQGFTPTSTTAASLPWMTPWNFST